MDPTDPASAIVVRVPIPARLAGLRAHWQAEASAGVPPHVTILFPFLPASRLGQDVRRVLAEAARVQRPFDVRFTAVGRFSGVVYVRPVPARPFKVLTDAVTDRFPDFPPYAGQFEEVVPHLTVAETTTGPLDEIAALAAEALPFGHRVSALEVLVQGPGPRWHSRWRIRLGVRR